MRSACQAAKQGGKRRDLFSTMGALHDGHCRGSAAKVTMRRGGGFHLCKSYSVCPMKISPNIRARSTGSRTVGKRGVGVALRTFGRRNVSRGRRDICYCRGLSERLCGNASGHFRGVTTIVSKLFHITRSDLAFFGQKDPAQVAIIRPHGAGSESWRGIVVCPIVREADGLAMSVRGMHTKCAKRKSALVCPVACSGEKVIRARGAVHRQSLGRGGKTSICRGTRPRLDYFEIVNPDTLEPVDTLATQPWRPWRRLSEARA